MLLIATKYNEIVSGQRRSGRYKISRGSTVINLSLRFILVLLAKSEMELLIFFGISNFLVEIVLCSSNQSMFYCELTPSYKSCTPKFRI